MSVMTRQLDKMGEKLARHQSTAKKFLEKLLSHEQRVSPSNKLK
jgi:predicted transcriptional regulator